MPVETRLARLLDKANSLPLSPGVYLMRDENGKVIYVGKSRKLKNRVSQYFRGGDKDYKTARMVSRVYQFDYFLCDTEIEALALENTLIKQYTPRYNIRLKDAKSYPYIKITDEAYPRLVFTRAREADKGRYFGPYSGGSVASTVIRTLNKTLALPTCKRQFPRDIGRERPCLYYQLGQCVGVCTGNVTPESYRERIRYATEVLRGNSAAARRRIREEMNAAAESEEFEKAAVLRDTLFALENLSNKQKVVASPDTAEDVFGFYRDEFGAVISVFYVREGALVDKTEFDFSPDELFDENEAILSFLYEHYKNRTDIPPRVLLSFSQDEEDAALFASFLREAAGRKVVVHSPERGELKTLCELAISNARECAAALRREAEKSDEVALRMADLLALEVVPSRIESYDISNLGDEHITCGMIVWENGKLKPNEYRTFRIRTTEGADDYAAMREALSRRFSHFGKGEGAFAREPDLILLDGGRAHVAVARRLAEEMGITVPIFGMVKDDYHKTRALCGENEEISIALDKGVYTTVYRIQEEVHRYSVRRMTEAKRKTVRTSELEKIKGVGKEKAKAILAYFGGLAAVKRADRKDLAKAPGVGISLAEAIYAYFHGKEN